ncbi:MAG: hypothetical protein EAX95_05345 [Candidatus Thorarchaeota archaeon]|nr:hypothetical protein [Candidatus Thorarchaeota archaeon]
MKSRLIPADANAPMLSVNRKMGFMQYRRELFVKYNTDNVLNSSTIADSCNWFIQAGELFHLTEPKCSLHLDNLLNPLHIFSRRI